METRQDKRVFIVIVIVLLVMLCLLIGNARESGGDPSSSGSDLADPKWDMYFECTARQRDGGYGVVEAGARCEALRPE